MLNLIPYQPPFLDAFIVWRAQPLSIRFNPLREMNREEISTMLEAEGAELTDLNKYENYRWFIEYDGEVVGNVSVGVTTAAVKMLVQKCFSESPLRKLIAYVHHENVASCRVLQKVGFTQEGILREHYIINGVAQNEIVFGLLKHEWKP
jgi:[ribosomal protein S5]-alanine N-acetyltransferase